MQEHATLVFKPHPSDNRRTWRFLGLFLIPYAFITVAVWTMSLWVAIPWTLAVLLALTIVFLILFRTVSLVDYRLEANALVLRYGTLVNYRLPYRTIKSVRRYNMTSLRHAPLPGSWVKTPGLDTSAYHTDDAGDIRLLATTSTGPIVLIESESGNYGINPVDEEGFISALRQRIRWGGEDWGYKEDQST